MDSPITALHTRLCLPSEDGQGTIPNSLYKKVDFTLHNVHEARVLVIKASATGSVVSRTAIV